MSIINAECIVTLQRASFGEFTEILKSYGYYEVDKETGCWLWLRRLSDKGYAEFGRGGTFGRTKKAHKIFYEKKYGPMLPGEESGHTCHVRRCVNPDHIFACTHKENCNMEH